MAGKFSGHVVLITGASEGIGAETAKVFAREGAKVALIARKKDKLEQVKDTILQAGGIAEYFVADVTDYDGLKNAVAETVKLWGKIDVVLANAGMGISGHIAELKVEDFRKQFEVNFFGVLNTIELTLPYLIQQKGRLGLVGSVAGRVSTPLSAPYCSSKYAIVALSECSYFDLKPLGVSVTCINPGFIATTIRQKNKYGELTRRSDPIPSFLVYSVEKTAKQIVCAMYKRKPEIVITMHGKISVFFARHFPRMYRFLVGLVPSKKAVKLPLPVHPFEGEKNNN